ncbi:MAG: gliding motility-associated C-terminal domain-containing protein [Bacteroidales bacterium]|nr:gliding motility-associated C-terminal domain-containing protein [Bacteroidales bacterium]
MRGILISVFILFGWITLNGQDDILPDTIRSCKVDSLLLEVPPDYDTYLWSTGSTTHYTYIYNSGDYWVNVIAGDTVDFTDATFVNILYAGIVQPDTTILCGDTIVLNVDSTQYNFFWEPDTSITDSVVVFPRDTATYYVTISDPDSSYNYCLDSVIVSVEPVIIVDSMIQLEMGCPDEDIAKMNVEVSGGYPPYSYDWQDEGIPEYGDSSIVYRMTDGDKTIIITDSIGCYVKHDYYIKPFPLPEIELSVDPSDTVYIQKPFVTLHYENISYDSLGVDTFQLNNWIWIFYNTTMDDSVTYISLSPNHTYSRVGTHDVVFDYTTFYGCKGSDSLKIEVKPVELLIPSVFTPNGDKFNQKFEIFEDEGGGNNNGENLKSTMSDTPIDLSKYYVSNTLIVFNRWGKKVFEVDNYENDWEGEGLNDGVYYYLLRCVGATENKDYKGSVMILTTNP